MDRQCSRHSPYQPSAGRVYLEWLRVSGKDERIDDRCRALELSLRPLSASELQEHHEREDYLKLYANDRWARIEHIRKLEERAFGALPQRRLPPAKTNNGKDNTFRQLSEGNHQRWPPNPRPCPLHLVNEDHWRQQSPGTKRDQRGYLEFEIADQNRRMARMGLGGQQSYGEGALPQTTIPLPVPEPSNHHFPGSWAPQNIPPQQKQKQLKAQERQSEASAHGQWARDRTDNVSLETRTWQEAERRRVARVAQHKSEQQKVQFSVAKPGNLYPGPSRIAGIPPSVRIAHHDNMEQGIMSELALSAHLKSQMASQEAWKKYRERKRKEEVERKAALSVRTSETTNTQSVEQLLASVNKALEQKVKAAEVGTATCESVENEAPQAQSQQPCKDPEDAYQAGLGRRQNVIHDYIKGCPTPKRLDGLPIVEDKSVALQGEVPLTSFRTSDYRAIIEAIDKASADLLESPKIAPGQDDPPRFEPSTASIPQNGEHKSVAHVDTSQGEVSFILSRISDYLAVIGAVDRTSGEFLEGPKTVSGQNEQPRLELSKVSMPQNEGKCVSAPQAEQIPRSSVLREEEESVDDAVEAGPLEDVQIQMEWEEVDDGFGDDEWSDVEQDIVDSVSTGNSNSSDVEWASESAQDGACDIWGH